MPDVDVDGTVFGYAEDRTGTRAIKIWAKGTENSAIEYKFRPDPHKNKEYNKNPPKFYLKAAKEIGQHYVANAAFPPDQHTITVLGEDYTLELQ